MLRRPFAVLALALLAACCGWSLISSGDRGSYDFQAFYCAGAALRMHEDPYRAQPLGSCEHRQTDGTYAALPAGVVLPAPQPPYDIAAFAVLSHLPFALAKALWGALLALAVIITIGCVWRITRGSLLLVIMAFAASLVLPSFAFGQSVAFFVAAACAAMLFAEQGRWTAAAAAAAVCLIEPHLGLPLCVSLVLWQPRTRVPMLLGVCALAAIAVAAAGWPQNIEYLTTVLPLHALSEVSSDAQLSLTTVLYAMHVPDVAAVRVAAVSYALIAACGIYLAKLLAQRFESAAFLVAVPAAFATMGAAFMHATEIVAAVPLVLLLLARAPQRQELILTAAVLLCIPWIEGIERGNALAFAMLGSMAAALLLWQPGSERIVPALGAAAASFGLLLAAPAWYAHTAIHLNPPSAHAIIDPAFAQASWRRWNESALSGGAPITWLLRGLTWIGLAMLASAVAAISRRDAARRPVPAQSKPSAR